MKHSNIFKFGVAGLAIAALAGTFANTAQAATEPFTATANVAILATLDVTEDVQLNFGRVILGSAGSFVVVVKGSAARLMSFPTRRRATTAAISKSASRFSDAHSRASSH